MSVTQILAVDDSPAWERFVRGILESESDLKIIATSKDGLEAVQKAKGLQPDLVLMDFNLPGIDGLEVTRRIRMLSPTSKILFLSGLRESDFIEAALRVGALGYVWKPDSDSDLLTAIRVVLRGRQFVSRSLIN